ncbi:MAG: winged helix DNA-binding domain-containing protein [Gammaproteobacteria bacterium]|nr:winged helix DNA-binding domain-containing protein [Gammaproteobacteria bacterium]
MAANHISLAEARRITLAAQGFGEQRSQTRATWPRVRKAIERMSLLQIDSINVLVRSHYLPAFSRVGAYNIATFNTKAFDPHRRELFEYWGHEASLLPLALHPLLRWRMARARELEGVYGHVVRAVRCQRRYIDSVLDEIRDRGPLSARELSNRGRSGGSWSWGDGKIALEYLFWSGEITAYTRRRFERVYDLTERVLPPDIIALPTPTEPEAQRELVRLAARALGVATEADLRDYFRLPTTNSKQCVAELVENGDLLSVQVDSWRGCAYLDPHARIPRRVPGSALLSPFDPLIWERSRTEKLFDFRYRLEIYTPAEKRKHGYYVLPFLLNERLVARTDLKVDRSSQTLCVLAVHGEVAIDREHVSQALAQELYRLTAWLGLKNIALTRRGNLARSLRASLARTPVDIQA